MQGDEAVKEAILRMFVDFFQHEGIANPLNFAYVDWLSEQAGLALQSSCFECVAPSSVQRPATWLVGMC